MGAQIRPAVVLASLPPRIDRVVRPWAERAPDHPALVGGGGSWSYSQLDAAIAATQRWLVDRGVRPGDRVMIIGENCRPLVAVILAVSALDAWPVIVNPRLSDREIDLIRDHSGARRVVYAVAASSHAKAHGQRHGAAIEEVAKLGALAIGRLNDAAEAEPVEADGDRQVAALIYTSGTTGRRKGVMLTHRNLLFVAHVSSAIRALGPDDRVYAVMPISHVVGLTVVLLAGLLRGAAIHLCTRFDPAAMLAALTRERLTVMHGVPPMFQILLEYAKRKGLAAVPDHALRNISTSGAPLDAALKADVERLFGITLNNGYGTTECAPTIAQTPIEGRRGDSSVGRVLPGVEIKLVGPDGGTVRDGEAGELWVRGPNVMKGYDKAPEETAAAVDSAGWFNTRDLARLEDGHLFIVGRTGDLIIRFGYNVYPAEIEAVLNAHPAVTQSAVIGQRMAGNEDVIAFVQPMPGASITVLELADYAAQRLVAYKRPSRIFIIPTLPASATGKILKSVLVALARTLPARPSQAMARPTP
jgi:long-chain acyl-CoA synthetase